jgi:SIR2-like domain
MPATALTISIPQTIDLLDSDFAKLAEGVAESRYAFWLGSGISRERVDDLKPIIARVIAYLRDRIDPSAANCRFRVALDDALIHAKLSAAEKAQIDYAKPITEWPVLDTVIARLTSAYARLLDVRLEGEAADYLLWEAVDVTTTFAAAGATPDCEHLCIAILAIEGVLPDVASANWDGLIEAAVDELTDGSGTTLRVCVRADDLREPPLRTRLLKFHGCAIRAGRDPVVYRPLLIARQSQITEWRYNPDYTMMRLQLVNLAATKPTLMIGLSAQDSNIQDVFAEAKALMTWNWPCSPPAHVFAEETLGQDQRNLLRCVYRDAYTAHGSAIEASALLHAFAKPLLIALVLHVLCAKLQAFIPTVKAPSLTAADYAKLKGGIVALRNRLASAADPVRLVFIREFIHRTARGLTLFQEGIMPPAGSRAYRALGGLAVHLIHGDPTLTTSGVREMAAALALLGLGDANGVWAAAPGDPAQRNDGTLRIVSLAGTARLFFVANSGAGIRLEIDAIVRPDDGDAIIVHSTAPVPRMTRTPRAAPGRIGRVGLRNIDMAALLREATDVSDLRRRFREEAAL